MKLTNDFTFEELVFNRWAEEDEIERTKETITKEIIKNLTVLAENLQVLRECVGRPVFVNIAYRPVWWELKQGRSGKSQHTLGKAADIRIEGLSPRLVHKIIERLIATGKMKQGGLGLYRNFVHYDTRGSRARW